PNLERRLEGGTKHQAAPGHDHPSGGGDLARDSVRWVAISEEDRYCLRDRGDVPRPPGYAPQRLGDDAERQQRRGDTLGRGDRPLGAGVNMEGQVGGPLEWTAGGIDDGHRAR